MTLCAALLLVLAGYTPYWDLRSGPGLAVFGVLLVVLSLVVSVRLDAWTLARRRQRGRKQLLNRTGARARQFKFILGGVVIPVAALVAANRVELPNHQTPMSMAVQLRLSRRQVGREEQLGDAVLRAQPFGKVQGVRALQAVGSAEALAQLFRILREDPEASRGGDESQALSAAIASFGTKAKPDLLRILGETSAAVRRDGSAAPGDLFERHFSAGFEALKREVDGRPRDAAARPEEESRLAAAEDELKRALSRVEAGARPAAGETSRPGLVLQTFLQMDLKEDAQLLGVARSIAADPGWSDPVRGQALLLVAKLGDKDDLDALYGLLQTASPVLQARAMQAIAELQSKLKAH